MRLIDEYSYRCGVMDCFNEMVKAGVKPLALAYPFQTTEEREAYLPFVEQITRKYQTHFYLDDTPLITDLFPFSLNQNTYNIIFYRNEEDICAYESLKELKNEALQTHNYEVLRSEIAQRFGRLLGYHDSTIQEYINANEEKEYPDVR